MFVHSSSRSIQYTSNVLRNLWCDAGRTWIRHQQDFVTSRICDAGADGQLGEPPLAQGYPVLITCSQTILSKLECLPSCCGYRISYCIIGACFLTNQRDGDTDDVLQCMCKEVHVMHGKAHGSVRIQISCQYGLGLSQASMVLVG